MNVHALRRRLIARRAHPPSDVRETVATEWPTARREYENEMAKAVPAAASTSRDVLSGVGTDVVRAPGRPADRVVVFLHGGGYTMGSPGTHRPLAARLAAAGDTAVYVPDYRLAPEHPFPAGLRDARAVWDHLVHVEGRPAASIGLLGDSAGGGLAAALTLQLLADDEDPPATLVLLSPWADLTLTAPSLAVPFESDPMVDCGFLEDARRAYIPTQDPTDPLISPAHGDWRGAPPALIHAGRSERLIDDARALFAAMAAADVVVRLEEWDDVVHVWHQFAPALPQATDAIDRVGRHVRRQVAAKGSES
jgi:monoterpene epsilon-lactone hydrolase